MSKVILYMAISANGFIAREDDDTSWISAKEWESYSEFVRRAGCLIVGHRTYNILTKQPEFSEFEKIKIVVLSHKDFKTLASHHLVAKNPKEALNLLKDFKEVVVAGGGILNSSFIKQGLIDEVYLDIEPIILGNGIKLFAEDKFSIDLKLLDFKKISENEIQLHYEIEK
ncbi:dihydrofolate reductase family protein [Candidatus Daviesbacteria bacterium]|nr:dihydrofolate reductase family protein [Candidatus Daviesbacteria bacterium]